MREPSAALFEAMFDRSPEPVALALGDVLIAKNGAWRERLGDSPSLLGCIEAPDHPAVASGLEAAREGVTTMLARPIAGPHVGSHMKWSLWPARDGVVCVRLDGPAPTAAQVPPSLAALGVSEQQLGSLRSRILMKLFEYVDAIVWAVAKDGTLLLSEGKGLERFGLRDNHHVGSNIWQIYPRGSSAWETTRRGLDGESVRSDNLDVNGWWLQFGEPIRDQHGEVTAVIGLTLRAAENTQHARDGAAVLAVVGELPMSIWAMDPDGTCTLSVGKGFEELGMKPGQLTGVNLFDFYAGRPEAVAHFRRAIAGERLTVKTSLGDQLWRTHLIPIRSLLGDKVLRVCGVSENITEQAMAARRLHEQLELIQAQKKAIIGLSSPIIELWRGVLVVPVIGGLDADRASNILEKLLDSVLQRRAQAVILDLTGVDVVDTATAQHLFKIIRSVELLGCKGVVSGIRASVAKTMVELHIERWDRRTHPTLADALRRLIGEVRME